uniref:Uncharacterized protein n=1 Tax=Oryza sativa subsp. japonica TaxID=39947 RepID=Q6YVR4_ORYSJ|nr:hypothetical protein [Oryza sativa Japonica Group]
MAGEEGAEPLASKAEARATPPPAVSPSLPPSAPTTSTDQEAAKAAAAAKALQIRDHRAAPPPSATPIAVAGDRVPPPHYHSRPAGLKLSRARQPPPAPSDRLPANLDHRSRGPAVGHPHGPGPRWIGPFEPLPVKTQIIF